MSTYAPAPGQTVKLLRIAAGLNQDGLARLMGVPVAAIVAWERGYVTPDFAERVKEALKAREPVGLKRKETNGGHRTAD